jgi:hypothetical protein
MYYVNNASKKRGKFPVFSRTFYKQLTLLFSILLLLLPSALSVPGCLEITNKKPIFEITFDETANLTFFELKPSQGTKVPVTIPGMLTNLSTQFKATVDTLLDASQRQYTLTFKAIDTFDNNVTETQCYTLNPRPTIITLVDPEFSVSPKKPFTVKLATDSFARCRYSLDVNLPFDDPVLGMVDVKEASHTLVHTLDMPADKFPDESTKVDLFVKCNRTDGDLSSAKFTLGLDSSPPKIENIHTTPQSTPIISDPSLSTTIIVDTNEPSRCKYSLSNATVFSQMDSFFLGFNTFAKSINLQDTNLIDQKTYNYKIACQNKAKLVSDVKDFSFKVDLSAAESIVINKPKSLLVSKVPVPVELFTNRISSCSITSNPGTPGSQLQTPDQFTHTLPQLPGLVTEGTHNYTITCEFFKPGNINNVKKQQVFNIQYDKTAPLITNFTNPNTCISHELFVKWIGTDLLDITNYDYRIIGDTAVLQNWTETTREFLKVNTFDLLPQNGTSVNKFEVEVRGKDIAGNIGKGTKFSTAQVSNPIAAECLEKVPPRSNITKEFKGSAALISIICQDVGSGCNPTSFKYGTSQTGSCSPGSLYTDPVKLSKTSLFCWQVADHAGNIHTGNEKIELANDADEDTIPDGIDLCPDTPKTETPDSTGCSSSQLDDDNDGIPNSLDNCPGTVPEAVNAQAVDANGCYIDTDEDGMPDYWEEIYKFNINDPSDAEQNPDNDAATNLQEYLAGTNPLEADVDPGQDTDQDGVPDTLDKCPGTSPNARADTNGCSAEDLDGDLDGLSNECEEKYGLNMDVDDSTADPDEDGLTNLDECTYFDCELRLDPKNPDTDGDGYDDGKENDEGTSPCDSSDYPESALISIILLILGILALLGGSGYLIYSHFIAKKQTPTPSYYSPPTQSSIKPTQPTQTQKPTPNSLPPTKELIHKKPKRKKLTKEQKHKLLLHKLKEDRRKKTSEKRGNLFSSFGSSAPVSSELKKIPLKAKPLQHILHNAKKISDTLKSTLQPHEDIKQKLVPKTTHEHHKVKQLNYSSTPTSKLKDLTKSTTTPLSSLTKKKSHFDSLKLLSSSSKSSLQDLTRKDIPIEKLKNITLKKGDLKKLQQNEKAEEIFDTLSSLHKEKQKASAYSVLSTMVKQKKFDKDIFKSLPNQLSPENAQEATAYSKLNKLVSGKNVSAEDISKIKSEKKSIDYLKKLANEKK